MKKTKIIASIGPSSIDVGTLISMIDSGMDSIRVNFSHGNYDEYKEIVNNLYQAKQISKKQISIMYDTKGPEFRLGSVEDNEIYLKDDDDIKLVFNKVKGNKKEISCNHPEVLKTLKKEDILLIENGKLKFKVEEVKEDYLKCHIITGGKLGNHKSITVVGTQININYLSQKDIEDLDFAMNNYADFLALSFVSKVDDINQVKQVISKYNKKVKLICKIENQEGINNLDEILDNSDGIMVARGDLGSEINSYKIPIIQKEMIEKARSKGKIAIVATEMLESMIEELRPTRAETSDVANAILDGTDAIMLSGETTIGKHPIEAIKAMSDICKETESWAKFNYINKIDKYDLLNQIPVNTCVSANNLNAKLIVCATISGKTAISISNLKPNMPILALCPNKEVAKELTLNYGVYTKIIPIIKSTDKLLLRMIEEAKNFIVLNNNDIILLTASFPQTGENSFTNIMKIEKIS